jgi:hypothetical protein
VVKYSCSTSKKISKLLPVAFIGMGLSAAFCSSALAADEMYHGNFCTPKRDHINRIERNQHGVHNTSSSTTAVVECPFNIPFRGNLKVNRVEVTVYDRHSSANVSCTLIGVAMDGNTLWTTTSSTSGSQQGHKFLIFEPNRDLLGALNMSCSLPPITNSGASHVTTYRIITTP